MGIKIRILITGANGYIGTSLYNALKDKYNVTTVTRNGFDLTDITAMSKFFESKHTFDVVIHCAVAGGSRLAEDDWNVLDTNLIMYYNLLAHRKYYKRLIHFGSGAETYLPKTPYGYSKKVIAKSILNQDNFYNIKIFGVFDERELDTRFIKANNLFQKYIEKLPSELFEEYEYFINDVFTKLCDAIEVGSITITHDQEKELIAINGNWKLQIQTAIATGKKPKEDEGIF